MATPGIGFEYLPAVTGVAVIVAALALTVGGLSLITYGARMKREALGRRVDLIAPFRLASVAAATAAIRAGQNLIRAEGVGSQAEQREIARQLAKFGVPAQNAPFVFTVLRLAVTLALGAVGLSFAAYFGLWANSSMMLLFGLAGAILGWLVPPIVISTSIKHRKRDVATGLPDALELLVICVEAGLSLEDGIDRIVSELKRSRPALGDELALTSADLKILPSRDDALRNLADRVDLPSIRSVVTTLSQTMRYGTPLAQALRVVASEMRNDSLIAMEDRANRLPALLTLPMMLFIMPTIFLVVGGPAALRVIDTVMR